MAAASAGKNPLVPVPRAQIDKVAQFVHEHPDVPQQMIIQDAFFGTFAVKPGQVWPDRLNGYDGELLVLYASTYGIYYGQKGNVYWMSAKNFQDNLRTYGPIEGARRATGMIYLAKIEVMFLLGAFAAGAGLAGTVLATAARIGIAYSEHGKEIQKLKVMIGPFRRIRRLMKDHFPELYDRIFDEFRKRVQDNFFDSIGADDVAYLVGQLCVAPGFGVLEKTFEVPMRIILRSIKQVVGAAAMRGGAVIVFKAIPYTLQEVQRDVIPFALNVLEALKKEGYNVNDLRSRYTEQVRRHPNEFMEVMRLFKQTQEELEKIDRQRW